MNQQLTIGPERLQLLFHPGNIDPLSMYSDSDLARMAVITPTATVTIAETLEPELYDGLLLSLRFRQLFETVYLAPPPDSLAVAPLAAKHVVGLLILMQRATVAGKVPYLRFPETYLHPAQQLGLSDMLNIFNS